MFPAASPEVLGNTAPAKATLTDDIVGLVLVLAYVALEIALFTYHTPWRDEAQAWLLAETLSRPIDFFIIPAEGHPPLWFWVLRGLSSVLSFDQARAFTTAIAALNAVLLWRLLRGQLLLLVLILCSSVIILQWGYHFRPYGLVLTTILVALLLDRTGRSVAATWVLAIGCGFHVFTGIVFGFWLLVQWHRGSRITSLIAPSVLAMLFGASAIISGIGNPEAASNLANLVPGTIANLSWWTLGDEYHHPLTALGYLALLTLGLWSSRFILGALLVLTLLFATTTAVIYGDHQWHTAFMLVMAVMAFVLAGSNARFWVLMIILLPQAVVGIFSAYNALTEHPSGDIDIYRIIQADAGLTEIPTQQLVGWPDYMLATAAATFDFTYRSGNNGTTLGPIDWRIRTRTMIDPGLTTLPTPYWVACKDCQGLLDFMASSGLTATVIGSAMNYSDGYIYALRIDR